MNNTTIIKALGAAVMLAVAIIAVISDSTPVLAVAVTLAVVWTVEVANAIRKYQQNMRKADDLKNIGLALLPEAIKAILNDGGSYGEALADIGRSLLTAPAAIASRPAFRTPATHGKIVALPPAECAAPPVVIPLDVARPLAKMLAAVYGPYAYSWMDQWTTMMKCAMTEENLDAIVDAVKAELANLASAAERESPDATADDCKPVEPEA